MSIVLRFLALLLAGAFVAYHRMRLVTWTLISVALLAACWFIPYVNQTATIVAAAVLASSPCRCCCRSSASRC
jgi:acyl-CoA dehydrogenase